MPKKKPRKAVLFSFSYLGAMAQLAQMAQR